MSVVRPARATTLRPGSPEEAGMSGTRIHHVRELARQWVDEGVAQALVVLVARHGVIVLHEAFGRVTPEADSPPTRLDSSFGLASITKVLTATALMTLVEEGRVGLNRPVAGYIPEFQGEGKEAVLVRHLLTHTSGIREEELEKYAAGNHGKFSNLPADDTVHPLFQEYLAERYGCPLWKPPGEEMSYLDYGFDLAGDIVRRVARTPLDRFARDRIFRPLGMKDTSYCRVDVPLDRRVILPPTPVNIPGPMSQAADTGRYWMGCGFGRSTALDFAIFGQMFLNGGAYGGARVLSPASVAAMTRNQIPGVRSVFFDQIFPEAGWGLGWSIHGNKAGWNGGLPSPEAYGHSGFGGVDCWVDPVNDIVGVYFSANAMPSITTPAWVQHWRNDLFMDAVTSSVVEP